MIKIGKPEIVPMGKTVRTVVDLEIDKADMEKFMRLSKDCSKYNDFTYISSNYVENMKTEGNQIWFEADEEYAEGMCSDRCDAFVVAMLFYAMVTNSDISCEAPVSETLLFELNNCLLPLMANIENQKPIKIIAQPIKAVENAKSYAATGMSCGVDSLQSLHQFSADDMQAGFKLTHLTYFNVGADRWFLKPDQSKEEIAAAMEKIDAIRKEKIEIARTIAQKKNLGFIYINSNISDIYCGCFEETHIYRSCAAALSIQGILSKYYLSSTGFPYDDFQPKVRIDPGHYEQTLLPCLGTGSLMFINSGKPYNRLQKIEQFQNDEIAQQYLNVCSEKIPCYHCRKDFRTIIAMEILGCEDKFPNFYDRKRVEQVRWHAYLWLLKARKEVAAIDLWKAARHTDLIPMKSKVAYVVWSVLHFLHLKK